MCRDKNSDKNKTLPHTLVYPHPFPPSTPVTVFLITEKVLSF